jgi:pimeloyl-ACP methyl ester carboxylesterase
MTIERAFVRIKEGQVHYRRTMEKNDGRPLVTLHMSPVASSFLVTLLETLDDGSRRLIAPDTLGNGDSCPLFNTNAEIPDFAEALSRALDALGIDEIDLYGVRTGSMIATELALLQPDRVKRLILDELTVPGPARSTGQIGVPCPPPDAIGRSIPGGLAMQNIAIRGTCPTPWNCMIKPWPSSKLCARLAMPITLRCAGTAMSVCPTSRSRRWCCKSPRARFIQTCARPPPSFQIASFAICHPATRPSRPRPAPLRPG